VKKKSVSGRTAPNKKSTINTSGRKSSLAKAPGKAPSRKSAKVRLPKGAVWQWSALETAAAIRAGAISAVEVIDVHIGRMRAVNPKLNAVVVDLSEEALKAAKAADKARAKGAELGLLHGVPITIKENVDYEGRPNPNGVPAQMNIIAPSDAPVVRNLRKAGAIVLGLTNTPEFSFRGFTDNPLHGLTLNPWDPDITCGGSSVGAGAAVAAGIGTIAHGNDIGGSLRWPAHCNGVATIKPTQGRIPAYNQSAAAEHLRNEIPPDAIVLSYVPFTLRYLADRPVVSAGDTDLSGPRDRKTYLVLTPAVGTYFSLSPEAFAWIETHGKLHAQFGRYSFYELPDGPPSDSNLLRVSRTNYEGHPLSRTWFGRVAPPPASPDDRGETGPTGPR